MKKIATIVFATALVALTASAAMADDVRISQVYGGGGGTSTVTIPTYKQDYVEIFNSGPVWHDVSNWAIVYGSSTGNWNTAGGATFTNNFVFPAGTAIRPCGYLLVAFLNTATTITGTDLATVVTPDFQVVSPTPIINMSGTNGKVMLTKTVPANGVLCGAEGVTVVDKVAWGPSSTCSETSPTAALDTQKGDVRNLGGLTDTNNNSLDFTVTSAPVPRNSSLALRNPDCLVTPTLHNTWGRLKTLYR